MELKSGRRTRTLVASSSLGYSHEIGNGGVDSCVRCVSEEEEEGEYRLSKGGSKVLKAKGIV